ncbi:MAG: S9 family peptidase [Acidobacteriota bacterium]
MSVRLVLLACLTLSISPAAGAAETFQLEDVFELESASAPQISPDGQTVVYVRGFADVQSDRYYSNLWVVKVDGSGHRPLTTGRRSDREPRWSPDGTRLAYVSTVDGETEIRLRYMDDPGGAQDVRLSQLEQAPSGIAWSPQGDRLAFTMLVPAGPRRIGRQVEPPKGAEWAPPARVIDRLRYRFDPIGYLPRGDWHVFVLPAEGGTARQVTRGEGVWGAPGLRAGGALTWGPEGRSVLLSANRRPESDLEPLDSEAWEIGLEDGEPKALTDRRGPDNSVVVSPDGKRIAYVGYDDRAQGYQLTRLFVADRDGSNARPVAQSLERSVAAPRWQADSKRLVFQYTSEGRNHLAVTDLTDRYEVLSSELGGGASAYAGPSGVSFSEAGDFAYVGSDPSSPGDVVVAGPSHAEPRVLTAINDDLLGQRDLASLEELWFESSHDGLKVQGWLLKPADFDPAQKYPLILEIHGGPFAAYGPHFDVEKQLMAASGYLVLYTNPRGSTSYGEDFGNAIHHDYPGDDFHDLMSGVDAVIAQGSVDEEQLFVTGGSGGGVLTSWTIGRSDRFRAAVTVYPVINWESWVLSADIPDFGAKYWFPGLPWDHPENYDKRSLLSVVKNVKTPTMVLTGEEDYRTPMSESEQYYGALKLLGVEAVLVRFPGENHGIRRRPSHWMSKIAHIVGWMDEHRPEE